MLCWTLYNISFANSIFILGKTLFGHYVIVHLKKIMKIFYILKKINIEQPFQHLWCGKVQKFGILWTQYKNCYEPNSRMDKDHLCCKKLNWNIRIPKNINSTGLSESWWTGVRTSHKPQQYSTTESKLKIYKTMIYESPMDLLQEQNTWFGQLK